MEASQPTPEHLWLQKLVGGWTFESTVTMGPDAPPMKSTGTDHVRSIGGLFILCEGKSTTPGVGDGTMILTIGFDPQKGRFVGTWIGSMMANLWVYEGKLDAATSTLTLDTEGPSMKGDGTLAKYRETIVVKSDDERTFSSAVYSDGAWKTFMTATYKRVK